MIGSIQSGTHFSEAGVGLGAEGQLALLVLETQQNHEDAACDDKALARQRFVDASNDEVAAMREEAGDILKGALVQGALSLAASTIQFADLASEPAMAAKSCEPPWCEVSAATCDKTGALLGKVLGDSSAANDRADAKRASTHAQQAEWQLDDARDAIQQANGIQNKAIDWLASETANQASAESGIIAGFA